jgi:hypothetical protein
MAPTLCRKIRVSGHGACRKSIPPNLDVQNNVGNPHRAGPSGDQTPMRVDGGIQVLQKRGHYFGWHRVGAMDSKAAILARARTISELWVTKAALGAGARVVFCRKNSSPDFLGIGIVRFVIPAAPDAPVPYILLRCEWKITGGQVNRGLYSQPVLMRVSGRVSCMATYCGFT